MTAKYAEFTEESNALDYLEKALRFIKAAADHPLAWKWVILSVHGALYGFMICTLKGTDPDNVCTTTNAGHVKLIDFREMTERNPIELVRQSSRRLRIPRVLTAEEILALLRQLAEPYHTMVLVAVCLGLRVSEIIGLQWGDFDWENRNVLVQRAVVQCRVGETKTETSSRPLPIDPGLGDRLLELRRRSIYCGPRDWVFANDAGRPRWQETILQRHLKPAALRAGIGKLGWHTFRTPTRPYCAA